MYRRELFADIRYPYGKLHEDEFTTYRFYLKAQKIIYVDAVTYAYLIRLKSIMNSRYHPKRLDALEAIRERISILEEYQYDLSLTIGYYLHIFYYHKYMLAKYFPQQKFPDFQVHEKELKYLRKKMTFRQKIKALIWKYLYRYYFRRQKGE